MLYAMSFVSRLRKGRKNTKLLNCGVLVTRLLERPACECEPIWTQHPDLHGFAVPSLALIYVFMAVEFPLKQSEIIRTERDRYKGQQICHKVKRKN